MRAFTLYIVVFLSLGAPVLAGTVTCMGTTEPVGVVQVSAPDQGTVVQVLFDRVNGLYRPVKKGEVLAVLDSTPAQLELAQAKAQIDRAHAEMLVALTKVKAAQRQLNRVRKNPADADAIDSATDAVQMATDELEAQKAAVSLAEVAAQRAELSVVHCHITATADGVIIDCDCQLGQIVGGKSEARPLYVIADLSRFLVKARVSLGDMATIKQGQPASFTTEAVPGTTFQGKVSQIRPSDSEKDAATGTVIIDVDMSNAKLMPNLAARVSIDTGGATRQ